MYACTRSIGAGFLHNEKTAAVVSVVETPQLSWCRVYNACDAGVSYINPNTLLRFFNNSVQHNLGPGLNVLMLNGQLQEKTENVFTPVEANTLPYSTFGMLSMCDTQKVVSVKNRVLVYYKYSSSQQQPTRLCTKLFRSESIGKRISVRFLQLQLQFYPYAKDVVELYNGDLFNTTELIGIVVPPDPSAVLFEQLRAQLAASPTIQAMKPQYQLTPEQQLALQWEALQYQSQWQFDAGTSLSSTIRQYIVNTTDASSRRFITKPGYYTLGMHVFASPGRPQLGFVAEVVTVKTDAAAYPDYTAQVQHQVRQSNFTANLGGALVYQQVGETNPALEIYSNLMERNGVGLLNVSSPPVIDLFLQNMNRLSISNNYIGNNFGTSLLYNYNV